MNIKSLYVVIVLKDTSEKIRVEGYRKNEQTGHNELLVTLFNQKIWMDAHAVKLYKARGSVFCWRDAQTGTFIELNETNIVCPECGWWKCSYCGACNCNKQ